MSQKALPSLLLHKSELTYRDTGVSKKNITKYFDIMLSCSFKIRIMIEFFFYLDNYIIQIYIFIKTRTKTSIRYAKENDKLGNAFCDIIFV